MDTSIYLLRNQFDNATKGNHKRMIMAATDHFDKLGKMASQDAQVNAIYQTALPFFQTYISRYQQLTTNYNLYQGQTQLFEEKIVELRSTLIRKWDVIIQYEYDEISAQYKMLLPNGRSPFQTGAYELRINAVSSLLGSVQAMNNPNFAHLTQQITTWIQQAKQLRTEQQGTESLDATLRQNLEDDRKALANAMQLVLFQLCVYYHTNLQQVETFYEWKYFKASVSTSNSSVTNNVTNIPSNSKVTAHTGNYNNNTNINIENTGDAVLMLWISSTENSQIPNNAAFINSGDTANFTADELTDGSSPMKYLIISNNDANLNGEVAFSIV